jgi:hypothetical protein
VSAIVRLLGLCARCWESTAPSATVRTELGACPDAVREMVGDAKLEHDQLRAALDTALRESAELISQRDTALGLCRERERELATVTAERDTWKSLAKDNMRQLLRDVLLTLSSDALEAECAAHAATRKALEEMQQARAGATAAYESTRAELAKAEARMKELKLLLWRWNADVANTSPVRAESELARETREALRNG